MIRLWLRKFLAVAVIALLAAAAVAYWWEDIERLLRQAPAQGDKIARSTTSLCYRLPTDRWLTFPLPPWTDHLKILSNAELPRETADRKAPNWHYALDYEVIDETGKILQEGVYHHQAALTEYRIPGTEKPLPLNYYPRSPLTPADAKQIRLNLQPLIRRHNVSRLRLRRREADPAIQSLVVRVYAPEYNSEREISYLWNRLPGQTRQRLAEDNVYPVDFLSPTEKQNLVRRLWRPLAPGGVEGQDYELQRLYRLVSTKAIPVTAEGVFPEGLIISPGHRATVPIPPEGGQLRFTVQRLPGSAAAPGRLHTRWYGQQVGQTRQHLRTLHELPAEFTAQFAGGLIELWSETRLNVQLDNITPETSHPIEPISMYLRACQPRPDRPVVYNIHHSRGDLTPWRVDFRLFSAGAPSATSPADFSFPPARVTCRLVDTAGRDQIREFQISAPVSRYDRLPRQEEPAFVSLPVSRYFLLPARITQARFSSADNVLISAYNRPRRLPKTTRVPADYYAASRHMAGQRAWFMVYPDNYEALYRHHQTTLLSLQYHPPERDPRLVQGRYQWNDFRPAGGWSGAFLFLPRDSHLPLRIESLAAAYTPVPLNRSQVIRLASPDRRNVIRPELVYFTPASASGKIQIYRNDRLFFSRPLTGTRGRWTLPPLAAGDNRLRIMAPPEVEVYMNQIASAEPKHMLRFANRLGPQGIHFPFSKQTPGEETLSLKLFAPANQPEPSILRVTVPPAAEMPIGPHQRLTIPERRFIVTPPDDSPPVPVMQSETELVTTGQTFFFPFGDDLPPGEYPVSIELVSGPGGYLQMYRVLPGEFIDRTITREAILPNETD